MERASTRSHAETLFSVPGSQVFVTTDQIGRFRPQHRPRPAFEDDLGTTATIPDHGLRVAVVE
jgi:hypothetical protein